MQPNESLFMYERNLTNENIYEQWNLFNDTLFLNVEKGKKNILYKNNNIVITCEGKIIRYYVNENMNKILSLYPKSNIITDDKKIIKKGFAKRLIYDASLEKNFFLLMQCEKVKSKKHIQILSNNFIGMLENTNNFSEKNDFISFQQEECEQKLFGKIFKSKTCVINEKSKFIVFTDASINHFVSINNNNLSMAFLICMLYKNKISIYSYGYFSGNANIKLGKSHKLEYKAYEISHDLFPHQNRHIHYMDCENAILKARESKDNILHVKAHVTDKNKKQDIGNYFVDKLCRYCKNEKDNIKIIANIKNDIKNKQNLDFISSLMFPD